MKTHGSPSLSGSAVVEVTTLAANTKTERSAFRQSIFAAIDFRVALRIVAVAVEVGDRSDQLCPNKGHSPRALLTELHTDPDISKGEMAEWSKAPD
jgi:hypothetical protein